MIKKMIIFASAVVTLFLAALLILTWRTKPVKEAEARIEAIGTVNEGSIEKIVEARAFYDALKPSEKRKVRNKELLEASEEAYDRLMAEKVDRLIEAIGTVTLQSKEKIDRAREAYEGLTRAQKAYVLSPELIDKAEVEYENCVIEDVVEKIRAMEELTPETLDTITVAEEAYNALSDAQKTKVEDRLGGTFREILGAAEIRRVDVMIAQISYEKGEPTVAQYEEMLTALSYYFALSVKDQTELQEKGRLDSAVKQFKVYVTTRELTDRWYIRQKFIDECRAIAYETLRDEASSVFGEKTVLTVEITESGKGLLQTALYGMIEGTENIVKLEDLRLKKGASMTSGEKYVIYGIATNTTTMKTTEEGSGLFGTNLFGKTSEEKKVPVITVRYTDRDEVTAPDPEMEKLFEELLSQTEDYGF